MRIIVQRPDRNYEAHYHLDNDLEENFMEFLQRSWATLDNIVELGPTPPPGAIPQADGYSSSRPSPSEAELNVLNSMDDWLALPDHTLEGLIEFLKEEA